MNAELGIATGAPCTAACPAGVNVQGYVGLISQGRFPEALDLVREALPFPGICGRVCPAPCESACERAPHGGVVAVRALKRFVSDMGRDAGAFRWATPPISFPEKIAVVGGGPAGLTAALDLRQRGYAVTILEARDELGGMLTACLPSFRLPGDVVREEIEAIAALDGIETRTGVRVGRDVGLSELLAQGYDAVLVTIGAHRALKLGVPDDDAEGVIDALEFLASKDSERVRGRVVVIGGGSTAMDAARTALRLGCQEVRVLYRRTRREMPAGHEEVEHALQEGVIIQNLTVPARVLVSDGQVTGIRCDRTELGEPDESGRRRPVIVPDSAFDVGADVIIAAIGQEPDPLPYKDVADLVGRGSRVKVDRETLQTPHERIFAAGDAVSGPATIVAAVGQGHQAARTIHDVLRTGRSAERATESRNGVWQLASSTRDFRPRITLPLLAGDERGSHFEEVESCLNAEAAVNEANRCLRCGPCTTCQHCSSNCIWRAVSMEAPEINWLARVERALLPADTAGARITLNGIEKPIDAEDLVSLVCSVDPALCRGCGACIEVCDFDAIRQETTGKPGLAPVARIDPALCRGCGICVAECPSGAVDAGAMADAVLHARLRAIAPGAGVVFTCQWSKHAPDNGAGEIRVPCAGRVSAGLVAWALAHGAGRVTIATCGDAECKYGRGATLTSERFAWLAACEPDRVLVRGEGGAR